MSADNYALIGVHPLAGRGLLPDTTHGIYVGFMSNDYRPSEVPKVSKTFATHEEAAAYADELETEYGVSFLCKCTAEDKQAPTAKKTPVAERENKVLLYSTPKKTVRHVIAEYADTLDHIYSARTAGDFTWKGLLHEFMEELAMAEDE